MNARFVALLALSGFAAVVIPAGCGPSSDELPRQAISGTVQFDGQPLSQGRIEFQPNSPEAKVPAGGDIKDGRFAIARNEGPTPGDYRVMITSAAVPQVGSRRMLDDELPKGSKVAAPRVGPAAELIPKQYNAKTTLTAKVQVDKSNSFEFDLKKK